MSLVRRVCLLGAVVRIVVTTLLLRWGPAPVRRLARAGTTTGPRRSGSRPSAGGPTHIPGPITTFHTMRGLPQAGCATNDAAGPTTQEAQRPARRARDAGTAVPTPHRSQ
ncbi:hypothetical protein GCM10009535_28580 [Streptomyces thermocarboxydovorans]|uniref:Secreted protein n=1 Tax=Streptomyces thermocarboxydovorans TaxID=59298 RepID=A0ABN1HHB5_9ACTN